MCYTERTPDGLLSWSWQIGSQVAHTESETGLNRTVTSTAPDGTQQIQEYTGGMVSSLLSSVSQSSVSYTYDTLNRPLTQTDSRTGTTTTEYLSTEYLSTTADVPASITDPGNRITAFIYDNRGRRTHVDLPNTFDPAGAPGNTDYTDVPRPRQILQNNY